MDKNYVPGLGIAMLAGWLPGAGIAKLVKFGKFTDKVASVSKMFKIWANSGPKGIAKAEAAFKKLYPGQEVPDFNPNNFKDILISKNKDKLQNIGEETLYHFVDAPYRHAKHLGTVRAVAERTLYQRVHSPEIQQIYRHGQTDEALSKTLPLPKGKPITVETRGLGHQYQPNSYTFNQRSIVTKRDGVVQSSVPAPGNMKPIIGTDNQPINEAIPLMPHEIKHIVSKEMARRKCMEQPGLNTYALGKNHDIPVRYPSRSTNNPVKPFDHLKQLLIEFDAIAKSRIFSKNWGMSGVAALTRKAVQDHATISMRDPIQGYFSHGKLNEIKEILRAQPLTKTESNDKNNYMHQAHKIDHKNSMAMNSLINSIKNEKKGYRVCSTRSFGLFFSLPVVSVANIDFRDRLCCHSLLQQTTEQLTTTR